MRGVVVSGRWFVVLGWVAAAVLAVLLPSSAGAGGGGGGGSVGSLLPANSPAVEAQQRSLARFAVPVISQTSVVVHDPDGLTLLTRADSVLWALTHVQATLRGETPPGSGRIIAAVPIPTASPQTAVTYLFTSPGTSIDEAVEAAREYAAHFDQPGVQTYVTGLLPAQAQQVHYLTSRLRLFEILTLLVVVAVVALVFRSLIAPLVVLLVVGVGYLVTLRVLAEAAAMLGFALPEQLAPLTAALFIGVVTDYCVLFFHGFREQLERGLHRHEAARRMYTRLGPIIAVAGLTVAGGTAALVAADFVLFRAFGPALALTVVLGVVASLTLAPALLAILGSVLFAPGRVRVRPEAAQASVPAGRLTRAVAGQRAALDRLQQSIAVQPGVAQVLGPAQSPLPEEYGIVLSRDGDAARYVVVFDSDPLGPAIADLRVLQERLPALLAEAGVQGATVTATGQTAVAAELTALARSDLWVCLLVALVVELVILVLYLRALVAPVALLASSALGIAAALGLTVVVFQGLLDRPGLTFYVPFAAAALLLALGSDYNVFAAGGIWEAAARHPLRQAILVALPSMERAITTAGSILVATFAMVAVIPLGPFRELAFMMAVGLIIDTFLVRPVLTPALLTLLGRTAGWPSRRIRTSAEPDEQAGARAFSGTGPAPTGDGNGGRPS